MIKSHDWVNKTFGTQHSFNYADMIKAFEAGEQDKKQADLEKIKELKEQYPEEFEKST